MLNYIKNFIRTLNIDYVQTTKVVVGLIFAFIACFIMHHYYNLNLFCWQWWVVVICLYFSFKCIEE
jgi:multisubunit Na+/H+ antiporter MnhE subunit